MDCHCTRNPVIPLHILHIQGTQGREYVTINIVLFIYYYLLVNNAPLLVKFLFQKIINIHSRYQSINEETKTFNREESKAVSCIKYQLIISHFQ